MPLPVSMAKNSPDIVCALAKRLPASNAPAGVLSVALAPGESRVKWRDREVLMNERDLMFPDWQLQYFAALSEESPETLRDRVEDAERAILTRLGALAGGPEREMEQFAIRDALDSLYTIKRKKLDFPGWC